MFRQGDHVQHAGDGQVMTVHEAGGTQTSCEWVDATGKLVRASFATAELTAYRHIADAVTSEMVDRRR